MEDLDMEVVGEVCPAYTELWNNLKQTLDEDMQRAELNTVIFLMKEKLDQEFIPMLDIEMPSELLAYLENNMPLSNAVSIIKHVLATMQYHTEFDQTNLAQTIQTFEKSLKRILIEQNVGADDSFIGRGKEMKQVEEALLASQYKCIWIHGTGGLGKTTLAKEVCTRLCLKHEALSWKILNVDLKQITDAKDALRTILAQLHSSSTSNDFTTMMQEVKFGVRQVPDDAVVVLLDNVEEVFDADKVKVTVDKMQSVLENLLSLCDDVVQNKMLKYIVTSRSDLSHASLQQRQAEILELELRPLKPKHARRLIMASCKHIRGRQEQLASILAMCGNVPLALRLVCNAIRARPHIVENDSTIQELDHVLQNGMSDFVQYAFKNIDSSKQTYLEMLAVYETSPFDEADVAAVLGISKSEAAVNLMHFCHRNILEQHDVCERYHNVVKGIDSTGTNRTGYTYSFHPLVWKFLRNRSKSEIVLKAEERFIIRMLRKIDQKYKCLKQDYSMTLSFVNQAQRSIKSMFKILSERGQITTENEIIINLLAESKYLANSMHDIFSSERERLDTMSKLLKSLSPMKDAAFYLWQLAVIKVHIDLKDYKSARSDLQSMKDGMLGLQAHKFRHIIADFHYTNGRLERFCRNITQAFDCFEESLRWLESCQPMDEYVVDRIADVYNAKGNAYFNREDYDQALYYHERALRLMTEHGIDLPAKFDYVFNVGTCAFEKGKREKDKDAMCDLFKFSLSKFDESMTHDMTIGVHELPQYARKLGFRWKVLLRLKRYTEAVADAVMALKVWRKHDIQTDITKACYNVAHVYKRWAKKQTTKENYKKYLELSKRYFNDMETEVRNGGLSRDDPDTFNMMEDYKDVVQKLMDNKKLRDVEKFVEEFRAGTLGASSSSDNLSTEESGDSELSTSDSDALDCDNNALGRESTAVDASSDASEGDSDKPKDMETDQEWHRRDSGFTESFSSSEVTSAQIRRQESVSVNPFFPSRSQSVISDDVFMDTCKPNEMTKVSLKRRRSP